MQLQVDLVGALRERRRVVIARDELARIGCELLDRIADALHVALSEHARCG